MIVQKSKNFTSVWIDLARGLDYLRLKKYTWFNFFLTVTILLDRLVKPVLLSRFSNSQLTLNVGAMSPTLLKALIT